MNYSDITHNIQLLIARLKLEGSFLPTFPQFRATLLLFLLLGLGGIGHGRLWSQGADSRTLSLLLSSVGSLGALAIVLLRHPVMRLKTFLSQVTSLLLVIILGVALAIGYQLFVSAPTIIDTVKYAWVVATVLLAYVVIRLVIAAFGRFLMTGESRYPGLMSAPFLFALLVINYIWWMWPSIISWL